MSNLHSHERTARRVIASTRRSTRYWSDERGKAYVPKNKDHGERHGWIVRERKPWTRYMHSESHVQGAPGRYVHHVLSVWSATQGDQEYSIGYAVCGGSLMRPKFVRRANVPGFRECPRCKVTMMIRNGEI